VTKKPTWKDPAWPGWDREDLEQLKDQPASKEKLAKLEAEERKAFGKAARARGLIEEGSLSRLCNEDLEALELEQLAARRR